MKLLIKNGRVIDPANHVDGIYHVVLEDGVVAAVTKTLPEGAFQVIDAKDRVVCPGFLDIHMHEAPTEDLDDMESSIFGAMLRMGVTTVLGGNCGDNVLPPKEYFEAVREGLPVNLCLLAGHGDARRLAGVTDRYAAPTPEQITKMAEILKEWIADGCFGVSYGIRYSPGITEEELRRTAEVCRQEKLLIAAHLRDDADYIFDALEEFLAVARAHDLPCQVSHLGSMGGYGQMEEVLSILEDQREKGLDVMADCYPYSAFSTTIGATTYDPGFLERYRCGYDAIVLCGGEYDGQRCTEELFHTLRREAPGTITVAHVMLTEDVDMCLRHRLVMPASDGLMEGGHGHPRAAGTFPRFLKEYKNKLGLYEAIEKITAMPARRMGLRNKGNLGVGSDADLVIFDPETIGDCATFTQPTLVPSGIDCVILGGRVVCQEGKITDPRGGRVIKRK